MAESNETRELSPEEVSRLTPEQAAQILKQQETLRQQMAAGEVLNKKELEAQGVERGFSLESEKSHLSDEADKLRGTAQENKRAIAHTPENHQIDPNSKLNTPDAIEWISESIGNPKLVDNPHSALEKLADALENK